MIRFALVAMMLVVMCASGNAHAMRARAFHGSRALVADTARRLDVNQLNLWVANDGILGFDRAGVNWGLLFPNGSPAGVLFSSGLWVGARVGGQLRVAVADYTSEYSPGAMIAGVPDVPSRPEYKVWKVKAWTGEPSDTAHVERTPEQLAADPTQDPLVHHGWSEYLANAAPFGAPVRHWPLPAPGGGFTLVPGPDVSGQMLLWSVFNDGVADRHTARAGSTAPLGIEVRQSVFGYGGTAPEGRTAFVRWKIVNRGSEPLDSLRVAYWLDPDLGGFTDDFVGCDTTRSLGFAYNAVAFDQAYGWRPPALGVDFLDDRFDPVRGRALGMDAFAGFNEGREPSSPAATWALMSGAPWSERPAEAGPFDRTGDPLTGAGDLDEFPSDRRMLIARLLGTLPPGDSVEVSVALVVGHGENRLDSIVEMQCASDRAQELHTSAFPANPPMHTGCPPGPQNCPRTADWYAEQCQPPGELTDVQLDSLASLLARRSQTFAWAANAGRDPMCVVFADASDPRAEALREYAALLANVLSREEGIRPFRAPPMWLDPGTFASCSALRARFVSELVEIAPVDRAFSADYLNLVLDHRRPIEGVPVGLPSFGGGAGPASSFLGSSLDPATQPDSFTTVRLDFSAPQFAHRYLRLEVAGGGTPPGVRFQYAGYFPVPFTARDSVTGRVLEVGFVERCFIDATGTIMPRAQQPATFDSTWAPDESTNGGREYLLVARRPLLGGSRPELAQDDAFATQPWLYVLDSRLRSPSDHIDAGDAFVFRWSVPASPGVDARLLALASLPPGDPDAVTQYLSIRDCLASLNRGDWLMDTCDDAAPRPPSLVSVTADFQRVNLRWSLPPGEREVLIRRGPDENEATLGGFDVGSSGLVDYQDIDVSPGVRYVYRMGPAGFGAPWIETTVDVPLPTSIALSTFLPNPAGSSRSVRFTLRSSAPATFEIFDLAGRSVFRRDVGALGPGSHVIPLQHSLRPGVYLMRLQQGGEKATSKGVVLL